MYSVWGYMEILPTFLIQGLLRKQNPPPPLPNKSLSNPHDSSHGCHANAVSHKRLDIQA